MNLTEQILDAPTIEDAAILWLDAQLTGVSPDAACTMSESDREYFEQSIREDIQKSVTAAREGSASCLIAEGDLYGSWIVPDGLYMAAAGPHMLPDGLLFAGYSLMHARPDQLTARVAPSATCLPQADRVIWRQT